MDAVGDDDGSGPRGWEVQPLQSKSLECSILVMVQSGGTPLVNSLWNLSQRNPVQSSVFRSDQYCGADTLTHILQSAASWFPFLPLCLRSPLWRCDFPPRCRREAARWSDTRTASGCWQTFSLEKRKPLSRTEAWRSPAPPVWAFPLTAVVVVDPHVSRCGVHDLIRIRWQRLPAVWRQRVAFLLQLSDQLCGADAGTFHPHH